MTLSIDPWWDRSLQNQNTMLWHTVVRLRASQHPQLSSACRVLLVCALSTRGSGTAVAAELPGGEGGAGKRGLQFYSAAGVVPAQRGVFSRGLQSCS